MKILSQPIEAAVWFKDKKIPEPIKFRFKDSSDSVSVIKINKIFECREEKIAGIRSYVYCCQSIIDDQEKIYELKYFIDECRWVLYKI